jgi:hypothetical protein
LTLQNFHVSTQTDRINSSSIIFDLIQELLMKPCFLPKYLSFISAVFTENRHRTAPFLKTSCHFGDLLFPQRSVQYQIIREIPVHEVSLMIVVLPMIALNMVRDRSSGAERMSLVVSGEVMPVSLPW